MRNNIAINLFATILLANLISLPATAAIKKGTLTVTIDGLRDRKGQVCLSLFTSNRGFPTDSKRAIKAKCAKVNNNSVSVNFTNLNPGSYAVATIHDANNDGTLNSNAIGIPVEGFGFSRNPRVISGPPKFGDTSFLVVGSATNIEIKLQYLL